MNWELELMGMRGIGRGRNTEDKNFFKNDEDFDNTIGQVLNETHVMLRYKKNQRKINYLKEQGKIL